jgi:competence protein ComEC
MKLLDKFQNRQGAGIVVWGGLASALLLGVRDDLDTDLSEGFRNSGCSHILALSGMHLAILSGVLVFLIRRPLGIRWASLLGAIFIVFYVFVAGSQPSLVRAAIMYLIGVFALWGFLKTNALSLLGMAFVVQLVFQSQSGLSISFILSYLALFGILTLGEQIRSLFRGRLPDALSGVLSASLGAFIVTGPVVALYFDSLRPIGILAGLVLAPISALFMVLSLAALAASFLPLPLWDFLDFVLTWVYRFLEYLVSLAGQAPG